MVRGNRIECLIIILFVILGSTAGTLYYSETKPPETIVRVQYLPVVPAESLPEINDWIDFCAAINDLDPKLLHAIITVESNWNPDAISSSGATGLMQVMPGDWDYYFKARDSPIRVFDLPNDPFDVYSNILAGSNALAIWKTVCRDRGYLEVADYIGCYNAGYNYLETGDRTYANKVIRVYEETQWE